MCDSVKNINMNVKIVVFCLYTFVFGVTSLFASNTELELQEAVKMLEADNAQGALDILSVKHDPESKKPQEWFLLGMAAKQIGDFENANIYFEKLLYLDPNAHRANLEMADIAYRLGKNGQAKQLLLDVKAANPPDGVVSTIDRFIANIEAKDSQQKSWRVRTSLGWKYDSNANAGPDDEFVFMYGLPFLLSDDAKGTSDNAFTVNLGVDHLKTINSSMSWQSNFSTSWTDYVNLSHLDSLNMSFSTGATWKQNGHAIWSLPIVTDWVKFGYDNPYYSYGYGFAPQLRYLFNKKFSTNIATSINRKHYQSTSERDLTAFSLSPSVDYKVLENGTFRVGLTGATERSGLDFFSNNLLGANGFYFHNFTKDLILTLRAGYSDTQYLQNELAYPIRRHDRTARYGLDLVYHVNLIASELVLSLNQTNNSSNIEMYDYGRTQASALIRKAF